MKHEQYDPRRMNVLALRSVGDCKIAEAELDRCASNIRRDLSDGFGDADWAEAARIALGDYEHKLKLVRIKLAELEAIPPRPVENLSKLADMVSSEVVRRLQNPTPPA